MDASSKIQGFFDAIEKNDKSKLKSFLDKDKKLVKVVHPKKYNNTPFHVANDVEILTILLESASNIINYNNNNERELLNQWSQIIDRENDDGKTPLLLKIDQCKNNKCQLQLDCCIKLLSYGANIEVKDASDGDKSPLSKAISKGDRKLVQALLIFGANIPKDIISKDATRSTNNDSNGAPEVVESLSPVKRTSKPSKRTKRTSKTSKPTNDQKVFEDLQLIDCLNRQSQSQFDRKCVCPVSTPKTEMNFHESKRKSVVKLIKEKKQIDGTQIKNLLSLDGGGIRGLVLIQILLLIEKRLGCDNIISKFHWVAGTSTGAIVSAALCSNRSLRECQKLYFRFKDNVFAKRLGNNVIPELLNFLDKSLGYKDIPELIKKVCLPPYDHVKLEKFLQQEFSKEKTMTQVGGLNTEGNVKIKRSKLVITAVDGSVLPLKLRLFRNYDLSSDGVEFYKDKSLSYPVWKAVRCSSAAPTYFAAVDEKFIDGGLIANNPTLDLLTEFFNYNSIVDNHNNNNAHGNNNKKMPLHDENGESIGIKEEIGCVLSIGTGYTNDKPSGLFSKPLSSKPGIWKTIKKNLTPEILETFKYISVLTNIFKQQVTESEGRSVDRAQALLTTLGVPYFRLSPCLNNNKIKLDETSNTKLLEGLWTTLIYLHERRPEIDLLIDLLN